MNEAKAIKKCPFCCGEAHTWHNADFLNVLTWGVECYECGAMIWVFPDESETDAIKKWNTRHEPPTPGGAIVPAGNERLRG